MKKLRSTILVFLTLLILGCATGRPFLNELSRATREADRIVLVEHSYNYDKGSEDLLQERIYREVVLNDMQKQSLLAVLRATVSRRSMSFSKCIFEPHHRFEFYHQARRIHALEVCFQCSQMEWDRKFAEEPRAIYEGLDKFVRSVGLEPERNWYELANQQP